LENERGARRKGGQLDNGILAKPPNGIGKSGVRRMSFKENIIG